MDTTLLASLTAVESALTSLTDSISSNSPSAAHAAALLSANTSLQHSLGDLKQHAENRLLLSHLHSLAGHLADTYKQQMASLAEIRAEIVAAEISGPAGVSGSNGNGDAKSSQGQLGESKDTGTGAVDVKTALAFARNVSRYAAPRGFKTPSMLRAEEELAAENPVLISRVDGTVNGTSGENGRANSGIEVEGNALTTGQATETNTQATGQAQDHNAGLDSLAPDVKAWLDPTLQVPYLPWPSEEMVARSGLARVTGWVGAAAVEDDVGAGAEQAKEADEAQRQRDEDAKAAARYDDFDRQPARSEPKPKVFTMLDLYDPDEE